jgi:putative aldouronate transport system substrate-binding protein
MDPFNETGGNRMVLPVDRGFYISSRMKDPDRFFEFLNWTLTDGTTLRRYGIEGKMYKAVGGEKVPIAEVEREAKYKGPQLEPVQFLGPFSEKLDWDGIKLNYDANKLPQELAYIKEKFATYTAKYHVDYRDVMAYSETESKKGQQIYEDYLKQTVDASIIDHKTTRQTWMTAVDKWRKAGGDAIIEEVNAAQKDKSKPNYVES